MVDIYEPAEDSYLLSEALSKIKINPTYKILDMGSGSGIQAQTLLKESKSENITLIDINPKAIKHLKGKFPKSKIIKSNLFEKVKGKFDLIIFNPPYLPRDKKEPNSSQISTTGGKDGSEIINKFLKQAQNYLNPNAKIFLLTSSLTKNINWLNYKKKLVAKKKLFFEELRVWRILSEV